MEKKRKKTKILFLCFVAVLLVSFCAVQFCLAASSCVTCHTDEDMVINSLSKTKVKKSALTSGAG